MHQLLSTLLVMYGGYYMFRHYIAIFREHSQSLLRDVLCVLCFVCVVVRGDLVGY
jgi:hypothetical protein